MYQKEQQKILAYEMKKILIYNLSLNTEFCLPFQDSLLMSIMNLHEVYSQS